ncbi:DsbA family protein [Duganella sp. FT50W]|uniref:DsbA family protein n=1 Tax=Duganella lactea TaxID=2692173 RepID=A0A6L8MMK1_9BURK|nr:DsbA family protein [Duganella lactea]MYM84437.1 DsbA family protein [Duganella lactea]
MDKTVHYLFDPLCGWCYGAAPVVSSLLKVPGLNVKLQPTGLFSGAGARPMDAAFAAFAWSNDQRILSMTGQPFSAQYREHVLAGRSQMFDSGPATLALTAVSLTAPTQAFDALKAIQHARYVDGSDVTSLAVLADLLWALGLADAAAQLSQLDAALLSACRSSVAQAQRLMQALGARGVPTLVLESGGRRQMLNLDPGNSDPQALLRQIAAA